MNAPASSSAPLRPQQPGDRRLHVNKACKPCRARKVKCDASAVGLPCSTCISRQCAGECALPIRKSRTRADRGGSHIVTTPRQNNTTIPVTSDQIQSEDPSRGQSATPNSLDRQRLGQSNPDLFYVHILNDAVGGTQQSSQSQAISTNTPSYTTPDEGLTPRNGRSAKLSRLDMTDREYLEKKGVFDLPPPPYLDALVKIYFDHVHPLAPVINRADFVLHYQSGDCSLLLLRVMLATACLHAPINVLSACGFDDRSAAQELFFVRARLLYDVAAEDDSLVMLQASIVLCMVILDHPTNRDFGYWFHNAISLATKLNVRDVYVYYPPRFRTVTILIYNGCIDLWTQWKSVLRNTGPCEVLQLYRKMWWALYTLDIFHVFLNIRRSSLLEDSPKIKLRTEDDWKDEDVSRGSSGLLSTITPQQMASPVVLCEMSRIFGECLSVVKSNRDPRQMMSPLDAWRESLASRMHVSGDIGTNVCYLNAQATSYRFECILCRLICRTSGQRSGCADWGEWAKQRFRSAILELDTIVVRVLASGTLEKFPITFVTTITTLLALHIESALDSTETHLIRSMSKISISQTMLVLAQGREIPVLRRALPIFEEILNKNNLSLVPSIDHSNLQGLVQPPSQDGNFADASDSLRTQDLGASPQPEQWQENMLLDMSFLGFDLLEGWQQNGPLDLFD